MSESSQTHLDPDRVAAIVAHMNDDHADAVLGYVHRLAGIPHAVTAVLTGIDADGMSIEATTDGSVRSVRIAFDHRLRDADDARDTLIALAKA